MDTPATPTLVILGVAMLILALCIGAAILVAAFKGLIDVRVNIGLNFGSRQPP